MIKVTADKGRFIISCPFHMNGAIRAIPGARWSSSRKAYVALFNRKTAQVMSGMKDIIFDKLAIELMAQAVRPKIQKSELPAWYRFKTEPMKHQRKALDFLWGRECAALFMAMRTGKTKTVIDWSCAMKMDNAIDHVLVLCPLSVRGNWESQYAEHAPIPFELSRNDLASASGRKSHKKFLDSGHEFKIMTVGIESLAAGSAIDHVIDFVRSHGRVLCVVDESHMIKTHNANRTEKITNVGKICSHRVVLTGTPTTASPLDLFSQYRFLDPDIIGYGDWYSFKARYAVMGGYENRQIIGYQNMEELMADIAPYTFQVKAEEVVGELPPKTYMIREVELPSSIRSLYQQVQKKSVVNYKEKYLVTSNALDRITRCSMLVNGVMTTGENGQYEYEWVNNGKINELLNVIVENPVPTVIWTTGKLEIAKVIESLEKTGLRVARIDGDVHENDRLLAIDDFQSGKIDYIAINVATGSTGIKLSRADMMVYMSNSFKYVDRVQSEERATDFSNVKKGLLVVDIVASNTVDDHIIQPALKAKQDIAEYVDAQISAERMKFSVV